MNRIAGIGNVDIAPGTYFVENDFSRDTRTVTEADVDQVLRNAYSSGVQVDFYSREADAYFSLTDSLGTVYGRYHFPTA